jgi:putative membrane protein
MTTTTDATELPAKDQPHGEPPALRAGDAAGLYVRGAAMGAADIVPGVSGGTIALVTGIYERFVAALGSLSPAFLAPLARGDVRGARRELMRTHWAFLIPLGLGIVSAILLASRLITGLMTEHPGATYAFFFGLILASAMAPFLRMRRRRWRHAAAAVLAAGFAWWVAGLQPEGLNVAPTSDPAAASTWVYPAKLRDAGDLDRLLAAIPETARLVAFDPKAVLAGVETPERVRVIESEEALSAWAETAKDAGLLDAPRASYGYIFFCGFIAISAMILPGLSGSFLLLLLGQYYVVLSTISRSIDHAKGLLGSEAAPLARLSGHGPVEDGLLLGAFLAGVAIGLGTFSRIVRWLFEHYHDVTMAALTGLMLGALRLPGSEVLAATGAETGEGWGVVLLTGVIGAALVTGLTVWDHRTRSRDGAASVGA